MIGAVSTTVQGHNRIQDQDYGLLQGDATGHKNRVVDAIAWIHSRTVLGHTGTRIGSARTRSMMARKIFLVGASSENSSCMHATGDI